MNFLSNFHFKKNFFVYLVVIEIVSTHYQVHKIVFFFLMEISQEIHFKSVFQGVFWKDNAKGFLNLLSKEPLHISK